MDERFFWLGFAVFSGIGPKRFAILRGTFGSAKTAWEADGEALQSAGIGEAIAKQFLSYRRHFDIAMYYAQLESKQVGFVTLLDDDYPAALRALENCPLVLFYRGDKTVLQQQQMMAIVGTRTITDYGRTVTEQITSSLVAAGYIIVSGLAFGVDATAHRQTIAQMGKTVAVLACGIDCCSPREHQGLYQEIIDTGGAIVSESGIGVTPTPGSFPARNRIIAGLSRGVVVTEGSSGSGSLYTAEAAFTINRPVFAIPGPITSSLSRGPFSLLSKGGVLVTRAEDILHYLGQSDALEKQKSLRGDTPEEQAIIDMLQQEAKYPDDIAKKLSVDASQLGGLLSVLEMKKIVKRTSVGMFALV